MQLEADGNCENLERLKILRPNTLKAERKLSENWFCTRSKAAAVEKYFRGNLKQISWFQLSKNVSSFNLKAISKDITASISSRSLILFFSGHAFLKFD